MACLEVYADAEAYAKWWCRELNPTEQSRVEQVLKDVSADISAVLAATGSCDCAWAAWVPAYLRKLTVIEAAIFHKCPCSRARLSDSDRTQWLTWLDMQHALLRTGELIVCAGETGKDYPAGGYVEQPWTEWSAARILERLNR